MNYIPHTGKRSWKQVIEEKWWRNQRGAIDCIDAYLASRSDRQAMIRMPTGTGKTAVIAAVAQLIADKPNCLIVAPWESLIRQLLREVSDRFWQKIGEDSTFEPKPCEIFTPSSFTSAMKKVASAGVLICTNQTLQALRKEHTKFRRLRQWCNLVLVDEGHREPAPRWAEAIRNLDSPTILFTATPYRNDLQLFDIDPDHSYSFTFGEAIEEDIVRTVSFIDGSWPLSGTNVVFGFVKQLIESLAAAADDVGLSESALRAIVRCENSEQIKNITNALVARGRTAIGIHETFSRANGQPFMKDVPDPSTQPAQFWVHQNKLMEGLDDPAFRLVGIFGPFSNARNLVQQIGRIIRNPSQKGDETAFALAHKEQHQKQLWDRFIEYESEVRAQIEKGGSEVSAFEQFIAARTASPRFYFLGDFRRHLRPEDVSDPRDIVMMRKSVLIRMVSANFTWKTLLLGIQHELLTGDATPYGIDHRDQSTFLQLFQIAEQSDVVSEAYLETRLGYVLAKRVGQLIFFYDSEGRVPKYLKSTTTPISTEALQRLLPDQQSTIKQISLINGDFGNNLYHRRELSTRSLELVPSTLSDYIHICSTAIGSVRPTDGSAEESRRRYLSFTRGRLSERTTPIVQYSDFENWLGEIAVQLENTAAYGDDSLERFARPHHYSGTEQPRHILFDIASESIDATRLPASVSVPNPDELWVVNGGRFYGEIDEQCFEATVTFDSQRGQFEIVSDQLDVVFIDTADGRKRIFTHYLNESQEFRVLLGSSVVYAQGRFFTPNLRPWRGGGARINIEKIVVPCSSLEGVTSEKGDMSGWTASSVFGVITDKTKMFRDVGWEPEILICNDVGAPEIADFFAFSEATKRLVMIHAKKARMGSTLSASSFHEVCSQAVRYLGFFNPSDTQTKLSEADIRGNWCPDKDKFARQQRLVWASTGLSSAEISKKLSAAVSDPTFNREVWLVMGNGLSHSGFLKAVQKKAPKPNEREISYLLQSTWCATASIGASLKVICIP